MMLCTVVCLSARFRVSIRDSIRVRVSIRDSIRAIRVRPCSSAKCSDRAVNRY